MNRYFATDKIIYAKSHAQDTSVMQRYKKKSNSLGYLPVSALANMGQHLALRSMRGDVQIDVEEGGYVLINNKGEAYLRTAEEFDQRYIHQSDEYDFASSTYKNTYPPSVVGSYDGKSHDITVIASACIRKKDREVYAEPLKARLKVFPIWDEENYILGETGDYLVISAENPNKIYIETKQYFEEMYAVK